MSVRELVRASPSRTIHPPRTGVARNRSGGGSLGLGGRRWRTRTQSIQRVAARSSGPEQSYLASSSHFHASTSRTTRPRQTTTFTVRLYFLPPPLASTSPRRPPMLRDPPLRFTAAVQAVDRGLVITLEPVDKVARRPRPRSSQEPPLFRQRPIFSR